MPYYRVAGEVPGKRHVRFRRPDGGLYAEELMGEEGFVSDSSLLYHVHPPTAIVKSEGSGRRRRPSRARRRNHPLMPRHFRTRTCRAAVTWCSAGSCWSANDDVRISFAAADAASRPVPELHRRRSHLPANWQSPGWSPSTASIDAAAGDYVVVPRGTIHRWLPAGRPALTALVIEASGHIRPPRRYLSQYGQFLEHAPYSERDLRGPDGPLLAEGEDVPVTVRTSGGLTRLTYARHPFDVVGWDGCLYPYAFNIADFEPVVKRTHAPPPVHQTFEGPNFVICSFCPRPLDFDPEAVPIPYNHHNVDSDEMMFYVGGDYTARRGSGVGLGSITLHPGGFTHGPQPGAVEAAIAGLAEGRTTTDETAVMIDTFRPLGLGPAARRAEDPEYAWSWARAARR